MDTQAITELHGKISGALAGLNRIDSALESCFGDLRRLDRHYADALSSQLCASGIAFLNEIHSDIIDALPDAGRYSVRIGWFYGMQFRELSGGSLGATHARVYPLDDEYEECGDPVDLPLTADADAFVAAMTLIHSQVTL